MTPKKLLMLVRVDILLYLLELGKEFLKDVIVRMEPLLILINVSIELIADLLLPENQEIF